MPNRIFIKVLLPEPFSPSRPTIDPAATVRSIPTLACTGPYDLEIPRISRSAGDIAWGTPHTFCVIATPSRPRPQWEKAALVAPLRNLHAPAGVFLGDRDLQFAGRELLLHRVDLGGDGGRHGRTEGLRVGIFEVGP